MHVYQYFNLNLFYEKLTKVIDFSLKKSICCGNVEVF